jgi:hypothetical protein
VPLLPLLLECDVPLLPALLVPLIALPLELDCKPEPPSPDVLPVPEVLPAPDALPELATDELDDEGSSGAKPPLELALHAPTPSDAPATKAQTPNEKQLRVMRSSESVRINTKGSSLESAGKLRFRNITRVGAARDASRHGASIRAERDRTRHALGPMSRTVARFVLSCWFRNGCAHERCTSRLRLVAHAGRGLCRRRPGRVRA